jgi:acyl-CoA dehydrogenase
VTTYALTAGRDLEARAELIAETVAGAFADEVDAQSRFPGETFDALRDDRLLSALVPTRLGGAGATVSQVAAAVRSLARHCASSAMVYAMHNIGVACLVRHGTTPFFEDYLRELSRQQLLLASATTEIGTGGDVGRSVCAVERRAGTYRLDKQAPVISYGENADAILVTARRGPDSPPTDQVMVLCSAADTVLEPISGWDAMGLRGTCSSGFHLLAEGDEGAVLPAGFDVVSARTNLPVSHILWSHVWLGIAAEARHRASVFVQAEARKDPGTTPPGALRLAELDATFRTMAAQARYEAQRFDQIADDVDTLTSLDYGVAMNALKVTASTLVVDIVNRALGVCGMSGYREDSPFRMGRMLRDAQSAALMLSNDRLLRANAQFLLMDRSAR